MIIMRAQLSREAPMAASDMAATISANWRKRFAPLAHDLTGDRNLFFHVKVLFPRFAKLDTASS
jgi:hypothetical protein